MQGALVIEGGVDITDAQALGRALWRGVSQTAIAVGPVFGKLPGGGMGCVSSLCALHEQSNGVGTASNVEPSACLASASACLADCCSKAGRLISNAREDM